MSLHKTLTGSFQFAANEEGDPSDAQAEFDLIFKLLSASYQGIVPTPPGTEQGEDQAPKPTKTLPFAVVLSFEERSGPNSIGQFESKLKALFDKLLDVAIAAGGGMVGEGALIIKALEAFLTANPHAPEAGALKSIVVDEPDDLNWGQISKLLKKLSSGTLGALDLEQVTQAEWQAFIARLKARYEAPPAAAEPVLAAPAAADPAPPLQPFELTQLMGWLTTDGDANAPYGFDIEGVCRFPDNAVQYGTWARLDVFGPDGSQLLTHSVGRATLVDWLYDTGYLGLEVKVALTSELRSALANPKAIAQTSTKASGRFWLSDGQPVGIRTIAIYVKPELPRLVDDCCAPPELEFRDCCGELLDAVQIVEVPQALAVTQTDATGYFEFSYASDTPLTASYALIQISGVAIPLALKLVTNQTAEAITSSFPAPVLLQIERSLLLPERGKPIAWLDDKNDDCGCQGLTFGDPNSVLEEYKSDIVVRTTDPLVVRSRLAISDAGPELLPALDDPSIRPEDSPINRNFRTTISLEAPVDWDGDPLVAQAVSVSHGRILTISQTWRADGYSLGDLRYSLPLAPLQKKNIAVIDWDRNDRLSLDSTQTYQEQLNNYVGRERDISEIANSALNESIAGRSDSGTNSQSGGGGISLGLFGFGGASGGSSSAWSSSSQNSTRALAANYMNRLSDQTVQSANALRSQRVTLVQQVSQSESAKAVTETVANRNACHAITVQYFEVLRHFKVDHELSDVRECLYIPLPITAFTPAKVIRWRESIQQYLPTAFNGALDACDRVNQTPVGQADIYADEELTAFSVSLGLILDFPLPGTTIVDVAVPAQPAAGAAPAQPAVAATTWNSFIAMAVTPASPLPALFAALKRTAETDRPEYFEENIAPVLARKLVASLRVIGIVGGAEIDLGMTPSLVSSYQAGEHHQIDFSVQTSIAQRHITRRSLTGIKIVTPVIIPTIYTASVEYAEFTFTTANLQSRLSVGAPDIGSLQAVQQAAFSLPLRPHELADRNEEDRNTAARLMKHLNANVEYYHKAIWWTMDPDRRFTLLDGFVAPNAGGRSVASVVENRLAAIIGNCIVMPVAPGTRLDYFDDGASGLTAQHEEGQDWLLARYRPLIPSQSTRISVPTRGVFAESIMGSCNGCEKIDDSRNWKYWEHPLPDEPTAIDPLSLASRAKDAEVSQPPAFPNATVVNQVASSIPQAPDPAGLASAIGGLINGGFRDATGLSGTQQNARDALDQSYVTTERFGMEAGKLSEETGKLIFEAAKMVFSAYTNTPYTPGDISGDASDSADIRKGIAADAAAGRITTQQAQALTSDLHSQRIKQQGGGSPSLPDVPEVRDAITRGGEQGAPISVRHGNARVDIGAPTRPAPSASNARSFWPFGNRSAGADSSPKSKASPLPKLRIEIVTAIRDVGGAYQVGEKSRQAVVLDCAKSILTQLPVTHGQDRFSWFST